MAKKNPISHVEWATKDAARLQKFYGNVFSWKFSASGMDGYTMVAFGNKETGGGVFAIGDRPMPIGVTNYYTVEELAAYEDSIKSSGGKVLMSNQEIPGVGWFSVCQDPDGNGFALWKQFKKDKKAARKADKAAKKAAKQAKRAAKEAKKAAKKQAHQAEKAAKDAKKAEKKAKNEAKDAAREAKKADKKQKQKPAG
jgi:uncharacterized protein